MADTSNEYDKAVTQADQEYQRALRSGQPELEQAARDKLNEARRNRDNWHKAQMGIAPVEAPADKPHTNTTTNKPESGNLTDKGYPGSRGDNWQPSNGNLTDKGFSGSRDGGEGATYFGNGNLTDKGYPGSRNGGQGAIYHERTQAQTEEKKPGEKPVKNKNWRINVNSNGLSGTFYRDIGAMLTGRPVGNREDVEADIYKQHMHQDNNEAARHDMMSQGATLHGTRNEYAEAGKEASFKNDTMNRQRMNQTAFTGSNRGRMRELTEPNVQDWRTYGAQQRQLGGQYADTADQNRHNAIDDNGASKEARLNSRDYDRDLNESRRLSLGLGYGKDRQVPAQKPNTQTPQPKVEETSEPNDDTPENYNTNWHHVLNYITFGNDPTSGWSNDQKDGGNARRFAEAHGWKPVNMTQEQWDAQGADAEGMRQQIVAEQNPDFYNAWQQGSKRFDVNGNQTNVGDNGATVQQFENQSSVQGGYANGTSCAKPGLAWVGENGPELVNFNGGEQVYPMDIKRMFQEVSDERCKRIKAKFDTDGEDALTEDDLYFLADKAGDFNGRSIFDKDRDSWSDDIIDGYAEHIRNYLYNYKPGTEEIDPRIDPDEDHIGPMAQDIEKVNPACIKETPEGVKTVDTGRLAMMNAGVIGDLARRLLVLEQMLGVQNG